ncbi:MAG: hypothetical protein ABIP64_06070 [Burkholderiales bacterium]
MFAHLDLKGALNEHLGQLLEQAIFANHVFNSLIVRKQAVGQLDQISIGLGPFGTGVLRSFLLLSAGSVLPNDRLHKIKYTLLCG